MENCQPIGVLNGVMKNGDVQVWVQRRRVQVGLNPAWRGTQNRGKVAVVRMSSVGSAAKAVLPGSVLV